MKIIVVKINGGLGNAMFQYALGRALSIKLGAKLILDTSSFLKINNRLFLLDKFNIEAKVNRNYFYKYYFIFPESRFLNQIYFIKLLRKFFRRHIYLERQFYYDEKIFFLKPNLFLSGYFQSHKYFCEFAELIRKEFSIELGATNFEKLIIEFSQKFNSVGIHFRRGDYINNNFHGVTSNEYYYKALEYFETKYGGDLNVAVFSDDITWVKDNFIFSKSYNLLFVDNIDSNHPEIELLLLSKFDNIIISNSTFSWWSAWLNSSLSKIIIAPKVWFLNNKLQNQTNDLIPDEWIRL